MSFTRNWFEQPWTTVYRIGDERVVRAFREFVIAADAGRAETGLLGHAEADAEKTQRLAGVLGVVEAAEAKRRKPIDSNAGKDQGPVP